jgi:catechol 2,3-dioxygenase
VLGFDVMHRFGTQAAFLSAGGYQHHIGMNTWESRNGEAPALGTTGLYYVAFVNPVRVQLAVAVRRVLSDGISLDGAADRGVSEAVFFT